MKQKQVIEIMARAIYDAWPPSRPWARAAQIQKQACRQYARAAIAAVSASGCWLITIPTSGVNLCLLTGDKKDD